MISLTEIRTHILDSKDSAARALKLICELFSEDLEAPDWPEMNQLAEDLESVVKKLELVIPPGISQAMDAEQQYNDEMEARADAQSY